MKKIKIRSKKAGLIVSNGELENTIRFKDTEVIKEVPENVAKELLKSPYIVEVKNGI
jgi:hypothetical protein